jgi:asparagine synthase (glutamine-hydrolysing)
MCGIAGYLQLNGRYSNTDLKKMTDAIAHRGPDGEGHWVNESNTVGFGHRRLSIIDLTECGSQPMHYMRRYTIIFNGEIYNYLEIKERLIKKGYVFHSASDTEVIMALYDECREACVAEMDGMFAFCIYDAKENTVFCARDRFGEKPFFYAFAGKGQLAFASEMKALWPVGVSRAADNEMIYNFIVNGRLDNPNNKQQTFYKEIHKLPPASYMVVKLQDLSVTIKKYWDLDVSQKAENISVQDAILKFRELFFASVIRRLRSDVPVGSSLSGGLDSSLIVRAIDQVDHDRKITRKTFSARFPGFEKDESYFQDLVINSSHVEPHFTCPDEQTMLASIDKLMYHQEEPFGSASIYAQYEVFRLAKENDVTVLLDGQGADEILAGYHYYYPYFLNGLSGDVFKKEQAAFKNRSDSNISNIKMQQGWKQAVKQFIPEGLRNRISEKRRLESNGAGLLNKDFVSQFGESHQYLNGKATLNEALYFDTTKSGLETLLRYADRNSMAHSREVRLPFLNHELVEFLFSLPDTFKISDAWTKWIMRKAFDDILPAEITWRKDKIGYEPPQKKWMQSDLMKEQVGESISRLAKEKILKPQNGAAMNEGFQWKAFVISNTVFAG